MNTVLLTGAGGAAAPALIARLRAKGHRVVAVDMDTHAAGLLLADRGYVVPGGTSQDYFPALKRICGEEHVRVVIPCVDEEIVAALQLEGNACVVLAPRSAYTALCLDKFALMERLATAGVPVPRTRLLSEGRGSIDFPLVLKPRTGRGSRGLAIVATQREFDAYAASAGVPADRVLVQQFVDGPEYTVSVVAWRDGAVHAVVPKEVLCKRGITHLAVTRRNDRIDSLCRTIQDKLRGDGPFNVQLRIDKASGQPLPFEINPRFSTTVTLTIASGVDEVTGLIDLALGRTTPPLFGAWKEGVVLVRRFEDQFMDEAMFLKRAATEVPVKGP